MSDMWIALSDNMYRLLQRSKKNYTGERIQDTISFLRCKRFHSAVKSDSDNRRIGKLLFTAEIYSGDLHWSKIVECPKSMQVDIESVDMMQVLLPTKC